MYLTYMTDDKILTCGYNNVSQVYEEKHELYLYCFNANISYGPYTWYERYCSELKDTSKEYADKIRENGKGQCECSYRSGKLLCDFYNTSHSALYDATFMLMGCLAFLSGGCTCMLIRELYKSASDRWSRGFWSRTRQYQDIDDV